LTLNYVQLVCCVVCCQRTGGELPSLDDCDDDDDDNGHNDDDGFHLVDSDADDEFECDCPVCLMQQQHISGISLR